MTRHTVNRSHLADVADVARAAFGAGEPMIQTVADRFGLCYGSAGERIRKARDAGFEIPLPRGAHHEPAPKPLPVVSVDGVTVLDDVAAQYTAAVLAKRYVVPWLSERFEVDGETVVGWLRECEDAGLIGWSVLTGTLDGSIPARPAMLPADRAFVRLVAGP